MVAATSRAAVALTRGPAGGLRHQRLSTWR
jgi:hypothetical protein